MEEIREERSLNYPIRRAGTVRKRTKTNISKCKCNVMISCNNQQSEYEASSSTPLHAVFGFLIMLLIALVGIHFQGLNRSPLSTHYATMVLFIIAVVIYSVAFAGIKLGPHNTSNLPIFNFICLTSGTLACELLVSILIAPFWLLIVNLCIILLEVLRRRYKQILESGAPLQKIYQSALKAFTGFILTQCGARKEEDDGFQDVDIV